jgi:hypothetical protein
VSVSLVLIGCAVMTLAACAPPTQTGLTPAQCERFGDARDSLDVYIADDWASFHDGQGVHVLSGVQRAVGEFEEIAEELETPETTDALTAVVEAGYGIATLAGDYLDDPPVPGDADDLADQADVSAALDEALASCAD